MKIRASRKQALYKRVGSVNSILVNSNFSNQFDILPVLRFLQVRVEVARTGLTAGTKDVIIDFSLMKNKKEARECLESYINGAIGRAEETTEATKSVVLEKINNLFFLLPLQDWFPLLKQFFTCNYRVIVLYQNDLHASGNPFEISYLAILQDLTQLHVELGKDDAIGRLQCSLFLKKQSGRVERSDFEYTLDTNGIASLHDTNSNHVGRKQVIQSAITNLTFNLSLSESQKSQKDALVLPYTMDAQDATRDTLIHYIADKNDDFDSEDDPDDDLEF